MNSSKAEKNNALATEVKVFDDTLTVELADGRTISVPLAWYPRLVYATKKERETWRLLANGRGIHWPAVDEDVSVANLLSGNPSGESLTSLKKWLASRRKSKASLNKVSKDQK